MDLVKLLLRGGALAPALILSAGLARASQVELALQVESAKPDHPVAVVLSFHRRGNLDPTREPKTLEVAAELPGVKAVELPAGDWDLDAKAAGYWTRSTQVSARSASEKVVLSFFRSSSVAGKLSVPANEALPKEVTLRFSSVAGASPRLFRNTEVTCPVAAAAFLCDLPAGQMDLRVRARGFISHYRWGVGLEPGKTFSFGDLALRRGASVSGSVVTSNGTPLAPSCLATLVPRAAGLASTSADLARRAKLTLTSPVKPSGFFIFEGVPVGSYVLSVQHPGFAPARIYPVQVLENAETEVRQPLVLQPETTLSVFLDPPTDSHGERWGLDLEEVGPLPGFHERAAEGTAEMDGSWRRSGIAPGRYLLLVGHLPDSVFESRDIEVDPQGTTVQLSLPMLWIEGQVRLGKAPLRSTLWFGGRNGKIKVRIDTDSEGRFTDVLPHDGKWSVDVESEERDIHRNLHAVEVRRPDGKKTAMVDLVLPNAKLAGKVVDEQGQPASGATVTLVKAQDLDSPSTLEVEPNGHFDFAGLAAGRYDLQARRAGQTGAQGGPSQEASEVAEVEISEDRPSEPDQVLVLLKDRVVNGQVTANGQGVPQARLQVLPRFADGSVPMFGRPTSTDVEGRFRLELPARTASLDLIVLPPGFTMRMLRVPLGERDEPLIVPVEPGGGGTLVIETEGMDGKDPEDQLLLSISKDEIGAGSGLLASWASLQGVSQAPGKLVVPAMEPGTYQACLAHLVGYRRAAGAPPGPAANCASGSLPAAGELKLKLKAEPAPTH